MTFSTVSIIMFTSSVSGRQWVSLFPSVVKLTLSTTMMNRNSIVIVLMQMMISSTVMNLVFSTMNSFVVETKYRTSYSIERMGPCETMITNFEV